jgi:hypothetical protein
MSFLEFPNSSEVFMSAESLLFNFSLNCEKPARQFPQNRTYQPFSRMEESGRIIRTYSGVLPQLRGRARHMLRCEHLRLLPGEGFSPYRAEPDFTHQIWIWYRLNQAPERLNFLFRGQFNFAMLDQDSDTTARRVTDYIANLLTHSDEYEEQLFLNESSWNFWTLAIDKFLAMEKNFLLTINTSGPQAPPIDEAYLQVKALKTQVNNLSSELIQQLFANILMARKIHKKEQSMLMNLLSSSELSEDHKAMVNRLFDDIQEGRIRVVGP